MSDWHINATLGDTQDGLAEMTEGIGKPLRKVAESSVVTYGATPTEDAGTGTVESDMNATNWTGHPFASGTALAIESSHVVTVTHKNTAYLYQGPRGVTIGVGGSYVSVAGDYVPIGTALHSLLQDRDAADQHPMGAVTGLDADQARQDTALSDHQGASANAHPISAITGLEADQLRQDNELSTHKSAADQHPMSGVIGLEGDQARQDGNLNAHTGAVSDAHPMAAITGLSADQARQDLALSTHENAEDPHPQYSFKGYGGILLSNPIAGPGALTTTPAKIAAVYDAALTASPVGVLQDFANGDIEITQQGIWSITGNVTADITEITSNASNTVQVDLFNEDDGVPIGPPILFTVPRYGDSFGASGSGLVEIGAGQVNKRLSLYISTRKGSPTITLTSVLSLYLQAFRVG